MPAGEPHAGDLAQRGVRLLRRGRVDARADAATLRGALERRRLGLLDLVLAALADQLLDRGHSPRLSVCARCQCLSVPSDVLWCGGSCDRSRPPWSGVSPRPGMLRPEGRHRVGRPARAAPGVRATAEAAGRRARRPGDSPGTVREPTSARAQVQSGTTRPRSCARRQRGATPRRRLADSGRPAAGFGRAPQEGPARAAARTRRSRTARTARHDADPDLHGGSRRGRPARGSMRPAAASGRSRRERRPARSSRGSAASGAPRQRERDGEDPQHADDGAPLGVGHQERERSGGVPTAGPPGRGRLVLAPAQGRRLCSAARS